MANPRPRPGSGQEAPATRRDVGGTPWTGLLRARLLRTLRASFARGFRRLRLRSFGLGQRIRKCRRELLPALLDGEQRLARHCDGDLRGCHTVIIPCAPSPARSRNGGSGVPVMPAESSARLMSWCRVHRPRPRLGCVSSCGTRSSSSARRTESLSNGPKGPAWNAHGPRRACNACAAPQSGHGSVATKPPRDVVWIEGMTRGERSFLGARLMQARRGGVS